MTAELQLISLYGTSTSGDVALSLPVSATATVRLYLTDLPEPESFELYMNGKLVTTSSWNSGVGYEYNIPLANLSAGTYTFYADIFFKYNPEETTNTGTLTIVGASSYPDVVASLNSSANSAKETVTPALSLTLTDKILIAVGSVAGFATVTLLGIAYKKGNGNIADGLRNLFK